MKKIEAFIQPGQFENVKQELFATNIHKMSVSQVKGSADSKKDIPKVFVTKWWKLTCSRKPRSRLL